MVRVEYQGTAQFKLLAARLRIAEQELRAELDKGLADGARSLPEQARMSALEHLPKRGRLNDIVAAALFLVRRHGPGDVEIEAHGIRQLANTNAGYINHPTFSHRPRETQLIPKAKDWFSRPMRNGKRRVQNELGKAMHRVAQKITH